MSKKEDVWQWWALQRPPLLPAHSHSGPGRAPWILRGPAFCPGVTSLFPSGEQWGKAPHPPFPPCLPLLAVVSKQESSLFTECPTASGSARWPLHRAPAPTPVGSQPRGRPLLFPGVLLHLPGLRLHSSVTGFRIPWVFFSHCRCRSLLLSPKSATPSSSCSSVSRTGVEVFVL